MRTKKKSSIKIWLGVLVVIFFILYILLVSYRSLRVQPLFTRRERINLVFYGQQTTILSIGITDGVHYIVRPDHEIFAQIPGGFELYRLGALGRLSKLEGEPELIQASFSSLTSSHIDYYFLPEKPELYDWDGDDPRLSPLPKLPLLTALMARDLTTNAAFLERLYLFFLLLDKRQAAFVPLQLRYTETKTGEIAYTDSGNQKKFAGFFFENHLREEGKNLKILYQSYSSAQNLSRVIEGEGIRVVDLTLDTKKESGCTIVEDKVNPSDTAKGLIYMLGCDRKRGKVSGADILLSTGVDLAHKWR